MPALGQIGRVKRAFRKDILIMIINSNPWYLVNYIIVRRNYAARIVCNIRKYDHVSPSLKSLKWIPVKSHLYFRDAVMAFKFMTGVSPEYLSNKFIPRGSISGRATRSSQKLNIPLCKSATGQRSFQYRVVSIWNAISPLLKLSQCVSSFSAILS